MFRVPTEAHSARHALLATRGSACPLAQRTSYHGSSPGWLGGVVVRRQCEDLPDSQVHPPLAGADVPDALQQFVEVVRVPFAGRSPEALVVHGESLHQVFAQARGGPLAELRTAVTTDAETDGEDAFETVVAQASRDLTFAFGANL